ncbi:type II secretion system F family protein [Lentibacillus saliphilus]|uniref:type II secretion system F family protein n=1 Tax=Lentibacillus saliphilus TaxID=2737028 RepID=UPI001C30CE1F|nr:type II secretion system F family protein [Lentibacillus saliphilus]
MAILPNMRLWNKKQATLRPVDQVRFLKRLTRLLELGYPLIEALGTLQLDKIFNHVANRMALSLKQGNPLDICLKKEGFPPLVTAFIYFARDNGDLQESIRRSAYLYEQRLSYHKKLRSTVRYPLILLFSFMILFYFIRLFLLPSFTHLLQQSANTSMANYSLVLIDVMSYGIMILLISAILFASLWYLMRRRLSTDQQLSIIKYLPVYRSYLRMQTSFQLATHVSLLLKSGLHIKTVLHIISNQHQLPILSHYSTLITEQLTKGVTLSNTFTELSFIKHNLVVLFQKEIDSKTLAKDLAVYAEFSIEDMHKKITQTIAFIQPAVFILLACFIILTYVTLLSPMLDLIQTI